MNRLVIALSISILIHTSIVSMLRMSLQKITVPCTAYHARTVHPTRPPLSQRYPRHHSTFEAKEAIPQQTVAELKLLRREARIASSMYLASTGLTTPLLVVSKYFIEKGYETCTDLDNSLLWTAPCVTLGILSAIPTLFFVKETMQSTADYVILSRKINKMKQT